MENLFVWKIYSHSLRCLKYFDYKVEYFRQLRLCQQGFQTKNLRRKKVIMSESVYETEKM